MNRTITVVGATGFVGSSISFVLTEAGNEVRSLRAPRLKLSPYSTLDQLQTALTHHHDLLDFLSRQLVGSSIVINAAGLAQPDARATAELYGANSLLPLLIATACRLAGVERYIHISSAAVQGRRLTLDESVETAPFSPYSDSKAKGERALLRWASTLEAVPLASIVIRATSVQGEGRETTSTLARFAHSRLAFVASPGTAPTVVSSVQGLAEFVLFVATFPRKVPSIVLQPWEGKTVAQVLFDVSGKKPYLAPPKLCKLLVSGAFMISSIFGRRFVGLARRVELAVLGQDQDAQWANEAGFARSVRKADL